MKTEEDEAFDELARRQGMWGGGFKAKQAMAADKLLEEATRSCNHIDEQRALDALMREAQPTHCQCTACKNGILHASDCAVHNGPAYPAGPCDCGVAQEPVAWAIYDRRGGSKSLHWPENHSPDGDATKFDAVPLYTAPPQREWVGLTAQEAAECWTTNAVQIWENFEAKLKEKNNG